MKERMGHYQQNSILLRIVMRPGTPLAWSMPTGLRGSGRVEFAAHAMYRT